MRIAVFPGSFDPITLGHVDILNRALLLFDKIIVAIGENSTKKYMFTLEQRKDWIQETFKGDTKVEVDSYSGLTVDFCHGVGAKYILRGLRNPMDFEFEKAISQANSKMANEIETVFLITSPHLSYISSSIVRDVIRHKGNYTDLIPPTVIVD